MKATVLTIQNRLVQINESSFFQWFVIAVIIISALMIGAKTHDLPPGLMAVLAFLDSAVTVFFLIEIVIRFLATDKKSQFFKNGWNLFDTIVVAASLLPIGDGALLARLLRVFRVLRLVSMVPELRMLINALFKSIPRMGYVALLMFVIFYIYAAMGSLLFNEINPVLWGNVSIAMLTLFRVATFEDWTDVMYETMNHYEYSWIYYLSFIFLTTFIFLNMMVGIVLEVMGEEHEHHRAQSHGESDEGGEPASRAQIEALQDELADIKALLKEKF